MSTALVIELYSNLFTNKNYKKGHAKRLKILECSLKIISTKGLQELTFQAIGKATGMSPSHVAYYFSSRDELIDLCCKYTVYVLQAETKRRILKAHTWQDRIKALVDANIHWAKMNRAHLSVWAAYKQGGKWIPALEKFNKEFSYSSRVRISAILDPVYKEAKTIIVDQETLTLAIIAIIVGTFIDKNALQQKIDRKVRNQMLKSIHALIAGAVKN